ncbi:hypothetical protein BMY_0070 [Wohlfahrtiimonas chitiniclastica]|nr:hypothetical protein BMY_0070 [Wohlfahrtiimonas chitiniclastica]
MLYLSQSLFCFLSCLCGSEQLLSSYHEQIIFLSCLCGSEHSDGLMALPKRFLSCLCGSERFLVCGIEVLCFLSCLCGSEPLILP